MKRIILLIPVLLFTMLTVLKAQQDPKFTHYMFNQVVYNPAFIGNEMDDQFCANLVYRDQWMGFTPTNPDDGQAPVTTTFNIHRPFKLGKHKLGGGLVFVNDGLGLQSTTMAYGGLSYHYQLDATKGNEKWLIGGLNFGLIQTGIDGTRLNPLDPNDPIVALIQQDGTHMGLDFGMGLLYRTKDYYVGFSSLHIPQSEIDWFNGQGTGDNQNMRHYYINGGYDYELIPDFLVLQARTLIKFDRAKWQADLGVLAEIDGTYWGGLNVRWGEGMMILAGAKVWEKQKGKKVHQLRIGVSYDVTFSRISTVSSGSLELMANYCFPINIKAKPPKPVFTPRFLGGNTL